MLVEESAAEVRFKEFALFLDALCHHVVHGLIAVHQHLLIKLFSVVVEGVELHDVA